MGMFDTVVIKIKCPYCSKVTMTDCQTKDLDCTLARWKKGDFVGDKKIKKLTCFTDCFNHECLQKGEEDCFFYLSVQIKKGIVTGKYNIK